MGKKHCGFSLVEIIVVAAIIAVVAGLTFGVLVGAKNRGKLAAEIEGLHQLGLAASIYSADFGSYPSGCTPLVDTRLVPDSLCSSPLDSVPEGYGNRFVAELGHFAPEYLKLVTPYRQSYVGFRELRYKTAQFDKFVVPMPAAGWLVSLTTSTISGTNHYSNLKGTYRRLCLDGSVVTRTHTGAFTDKDGIYHTPFQWFSDLDEKWIKEAIDYGR